MPSIHFDPHIPGEMARVVLRRVGNRQVFTKPPARSTKPPTAKALAARVAFTEAAAYSVAIFRHPERRAPYVELAASRNQQVFPTIMTDFLAKPLIRSVDLGGYHGQVGDAIVVRTRDDIVIAEVQVALRRADDAAIESGNAVVQADGFRYVATKAVPDDAVVFIDLTVRDADNLEVKRTVSLTVQSRTPVIEAIDLSAYHGQIGDPIVIRASDDVEVTEMSVRVLAANGAEIETGPAVRVGDAWRYIGQTLVALGATIQVEVSCADAEARDATRTFGAVVD